MLVVVSYEFSEADRKQILLRGYRLNFEVNGSASYGCHAEPIFSFDGAGRPKRRAWGDRLDPYRSPNFVELLLRMDSYCTRERHGRNKLPVVPQFPRILLGFAPSQPPEFEDSPALRRLAAKKIDVPESHLGANGEVATLQAWVGHLDPEVTRLYTHVLPPESQAAMARLMAAESAALVPATAGKEVPQN